MTLVFSAERAIRNALVKAQRAGKEPARGPCGVFAGCGATFDPQGNVQRLPRTGIICPMCAVLLARDVSEGERDPEAKLAEILDAPPEWIVSFLQGWDDDERPDDGVIRAWQIGKKLWRIFNEGEKEK